MRTILPVLAAFILAPLAGYAASFETPRGNIYSAGPTVEVSENAAADIVAAGGQVVISGNAGNGVLAAGGSLLLSGTVAGDARMAGGNITIADRIGGEAVCAGGRIHLLSKAVVGSELMAAAGEIVIDGIVEGGARIIADTVLINGTINGDADIRAGRIVIGRDAVIRGSLRYEAPQQARVQQGARIEGETRFVQKEVRPFKEKALQAAALWWVLKLIAMIAAALAVIFAAPEKTRELAALGVNRFGSELMRGFIALVVIPVAVVLLFLTIAGGLVALTVLFFYMAFIFLSIVLGALVFTRWFSGNVLRKERPLTWQTIPPGVLIYQVVGLVPFLGWIFKFLFFLSALGALLHLLYGSIREKNPSAHAPG